MRNHHTKTKGDLAVFEVQLDLHKKGYYVCIPQTEHAPFDLVCVKDGLAKTIQVKYRTINKRGRIEIPFRSDSQKNVDLFAVYCPEEDVCFYFNPNEFDSVASFRIDKTLNGQQQNVRYVSEYKEIIE